jgi:hypothetical protein
MGEQRYPLDRRLGGPQSRYGNGGEEEIIPSLPLRGINPGRPASSLVTIVTELPPHRKNNIKPCAHSLGIKLIADFVAVI